jgi:ABC-type lipoprotein release transport system permease subunit
MPLPLSYNFRNLLQRRGTSLMTAIGIALTVAVLVTSNALIAGLHHVFAATGRPDQVLVLRKGATSELISNIEEPAFQEIKLMPGIARGPHAKPMASPEYVGTVNLPSIDSPSGMNVSIRGITAVGIAMRNIKITSGRAFASGLREVMVGKSVASRYPDAQVGRRIRFGRGMWNVVGVFDAGESAANSEIWGDLNQILGDFDRVGGMSSVLVRLSDPAARPAFIQAIKDNTRLGADAMTETDYYARQQGAGSIVYALGIFVAFIMAIGAGFGAMNTMYAAVARRTREIGTLRALGFSRWSVMFGFMAESVLLALAGGILGCLITLPLNLVTTGIGSWTTFSEVAFNFRVTPWAIATGLLFAMIIGAVGGLLPAWAASRKTITAAMREV